MIGDKMRLDKFLSESTELSRKDIKALIRKKVVTVNGETVVKPELKVSELDLVTVHGKAVLYKKFIYLILNKPSGYVSATEDRKYPVVTELVPEKYRHYNVFCAGRLDIDTEGLLILTNDGDLVHDIISPKKNVYKRYYAELDRSLDESDKTAFAEGMQFKEFTSKPALLEICENSTRAYVEIAEGKFHQVKRMFERVGKTVTYLKRVSIGGLELPTDLPLGDMIEITYDELTDKIFNERRLS